MLKERFLNSKMYNALGHRKDTFLKIIEHLEDKNGFIVETGTARQENNWCGDGQSTIIFDWICNNKPMQAVSIDINSDYVQIAKKQTTKVEYLCDDSINALRTLPIYILKNIQLLYLDSYDLSENELFNSSFHHVCELLLIYNNLPSGCLIVVDDRHSDKYGKHILVEQFFNKLNIKPLFKDYQIGWIKL